MTSTSSTVFKRFGPGVLVTVCGAASVAAFFRFQILNGFTLLFTDRFDGMIVLAILEHWYNVFRGLESWSQTDFFFPAANTLGYQDGYFINGIFYSIFRSGGADPFLASELGNMVLRGIGFASAYLACRRLFSLALPWALMASALFTLSSSSFMHTGHIQLLSISLAPLLAVLLHGAANALLSERTRAFLLWGFGAALLFAAWLMTGYYMAWYFMYFMCVMSALLLAFAGRPLRRQLCQKARSQLLPVMVLLLAAVLLLIPFLSLYLPIAFRSGQESYKAALSMSPSPMDITNVGVNNLLYGRLVLMLHNITAPALPLFSERTTGMPLALLFLFGCAAAWLWQNRKATDAPLLAKAMAAAVLLTWVTVLHIGHTSLWYVVYHLVPGAKGMRATGRYQIFLAAPVIVLATMYLSRNSRRIVAPVLVMICVLLLAEELDEGSPLHLDRPHELARLLSVPPPPDRCKVFFSSAARPEKVGRPIEDNVYSHNVDAMLIAEYRDIPTINGLGAVLPPRWGLVVDPASPAYLPAVASFIAPYHLQGLCGLNLRTMHWDTAPRIPALRAG